MTDHTDKAIRPSDLLKSSDLLRAIEQRLGDQFRFGMKHFTREEATTRLNDREALIRVQRILLAEADQINAETAGREANERSAGCLVELPKRLCWCENCSFVANCGTGYEDGMLCPHCGKDVGAELGSGTELPDHIYDTDPRPTFPLNATGGGIAAPKEKS